MIRDDVLQLFNWFQLFSCEQKIPKLQDMIRTSQRWPPWRGCRWFQLFFQWFSVILFSNQNHPCNDRSIY